MDYFFRVQGLFLRSAGTIFTECRDYFLRVQGLFPQSASTISSECRELLKDETAIIKVRPMIPKNRKESAWKRLVRREEEWCTFPHLADTKINGEYNRGEEYGKEWK
jgi:hypothetical protein